MQKITFFKNSAKPVEALAKSKQAQFQAETDGMNDEKSSVPAVVCDYYEEGKFIEKRVITAKQVLDDPEKYDNRTLSMLIQNLSKKLVYEWNSDEMIKLCEAIGEFCEELEERTEEAKKEAEKRKELAGEVVEKESVPSNWELKKVYFLGKSMININIEPEHVIETKTE